MVPREVDSTAGEAQALCPEDHRRGSVHRGRGSRAGANWVHPSTVTATRILLSELFTRDGAGTLDHRRVSYELRHAPHASTTLAASPS